MPRGVPAGEGCRSEAVIGHGMGGGGLGLVEWGYPAWVPVLMGSAPTVPEAGGLARKTSISPTSSMIPSNGLVARVPAIRRSPARRPSGVCRTSRTICKRVPPLIEVFWPTFGKAMPGPYGRASGRTP